MHNVLLTVGTRPQIIKASVLNEEAQKHSFDLTICDTGQHYDPEMSEIFRNELEIQPDVSLGVGSDGPNQVRKIIGKLQDNFKDVYFDWVVTIGDTNSTLASSIWAFLTNRKQAHVEAGVRAFDWWLPEERNRVMVDSVSDLLFCPTSLCYINLLYGGLDEQQEPFVTGDLAYDLFQKYYPITKSYEYWVNNGYVLLTVHRQENMNLEFFCDLFKRIEESDKDFLFMTHPRTEKYLADVGLTVFPDNLFMEKPVGYFTMLSLIKGADEVWTDSGGVQRECIFAQKKCKVLREKNEWRESCPEDFGDGNAAAKIFRHLDEYDY